MFVSYITPETPQIKDLILKNRAKQQKQKRKIYCVLILVEFFEFPSYSLLIESIMLNHHHLIKNMHWASQDYHSLSYHHLLSSLPLFFN